MYNSMGYRDFPKGLRWLCWVAYPLDTLHIDFPSENLVVLEMQYSSLRQICKGTKIPFQYLPSLKVLDLSHPHDITEANDFLLCANLEKLILEGCANMFSIHESIANLKRLIYLNMKDCKNLRILPETILKLKLLETLVISGCTDLRLFSLEMMRSMESLIELKMDGIRISQIQTCSVNVKTWPGRSSSIWSFLPSSLVSLSLSGCNLCDDASLMDFPYLYSLQRLDLSGNLISTLPNYFKGLTRLDELWMSNCSRLKSLVALPDEKKRVYLPGCAALEIMTFKTMWRAAILGYLPNLIEWKYVYKLESIVKVDVTIIKLLGLYNLGLASLPAVRLRHMNSLDSYLLCPVQGLFEAGVFSTFLPGNDVTGQFCHRIREGSSSVSFTLHLLPDVIIRGLNICIVYTASENASRREYWKVKPIMATKVRNKSKALKWIYGPRFFGFPGEGEDMIWLSHWSMLESQFEGGDEVAVSVCVSEPDLFKIKECGVQVQQEKEDNIDNEEQQDEEHMIPAATIAKGSKNHTAEFRKWMVLIVAVVLLVLSIYLCSSVFSFPASQRHFGNYLRECIVLMI